MRLSEEMINEVRNSASITEVIGHYIPLVKKGKGYSAICPFHDDHDPSLSISEDKQIYKCFVCGNGGNVFTFVQNFKKISFPESVVEVSKVIGKPIDIEIDKPKTISKYQKEYDILDAMISEASYLLTGTQGGKEAKDYLINRGLDESVINNFQIGYNPKDNVIYKYLKNKGFEDEDIIKLNIARMSDRGIQDVFYNRILFPIHNEFGHPVAFTARTLDKDSQAKYINTSDTEIYTKGNIIYNYHRVKETIKKASGVIVVEGVMDVIAYYRAGIYNVVATLGTACAKRQLQLLKSLSNTLILGYDGDNAGINANLKLGEMALNEGINVEVIDNETELDPDEIISKYDKNALKDLSSKRLSYIDYCMKYYRKKINMDNYSDRKAFHDKMLTIISLLKDEYDIENYTNNLIEITKIRKRGEITLNKKGYNNTVKVEECLDGLTRAEYIILGQMANSLKAMNIYQKELGCLLDTSNQELALMIIEEYRNSGTCSLSKLLDETNDENIKNLITNIATSEIIPQDFNEEILNGAITKEKMEIKKFRLDELKKEISKYEAVDKEKTKEFLNEYARLLKELGTNYKKRD